MPLGTAPLWSPGSFCLGPQGCAMETPTLVTVAFTGSSLSWTLEPPDKALQGWAVCGPGAPQSSRSGPQPSATSPQTGVPAGQSLPRCTLSWGSLTSVQMQKCGEEKGTRPCSVVAFGRAGMEPSLGCGASRPSLGLGPALPLAARHLPHQPALELAPSPRQSREGTP